MSEMTPPTSGGTQDAGGATPVTTPTSSTPSRGTHVAPTAGGGEYFNQSRLKVIGLITAGVVLVGALGGIAGVAFDTDRSNDEELVQPGESAGAVGSFGNSASTKSMLRNAPRFADDSGSPTPVGSATPDSTGSPAATGSPGATESPATPSPSPTDEGGGGGGGEGVTMSATGVQVYVPPGWQVSFQDENNVGMSNGQGSYAFAFSTSGIDPSADAGTIIAENLQTFFPPENYTQFATSDIQALQPFGSVVSFAGMVYESLWVDNQGSVSLHGEFYVGVRQDGTVLVMSVEHSPVEDWDNSPPELGDIIQASYARFGGVA